MTLSSQYEGKCKGYTNDAGELIIHSWRVGDQIFYQRDPKCICINADCFEKQKQATGTTPARQSTDIKAKITRTTDERAADLGVFLSTLANASISASGSDCAQVWCRL
jgi:hypothetical protein